MATYSWSTNASGDWTVATNWAGGIVPGAGDIAVIDAPANGIAYTVTIAANETVSVASIELNTTNNYAGANADPYDAAALEVDGTLDFTGSGLIDGPLQNAIVLNNADIINAGTVNAYVQANGNTTFTGTNAIYFTNLLQAQGLVTVDTSSIAEYINNTLTDGIWEANGTGAILDIGGSASGSIDIVTMQGPGTDYAEGLPGWTQLIYDGPDAQINEWNGTAYVPVESTLTTIQNYATITVDADQETKLPGNYITTNAFTIGATALIDFDQVGGTLSTGGLTILSGGTLQGAPTVVGNIVNDGLVIATGGEMILQGSVSGTGILTFGTVAGTLDVQSVAPGQTVALLGGDALIVESPATFAATVSDVGTNTITLKGLVANAATLTGSTLDITNNGSLVDAIAISGTLPSVGVTSSGGNTVLDFGAALPVITAGASASYSGGGAAVALDPGLTVTDSGSATLSGATVSISTGFLAGDTLGFAPETGITGSYNAATGVLTFTGSTDVATYQAELDSVTYLSSAADPTKAGTDPTRTISWSVTDPTGSATATSSLALTSTQTSTPVPDDFNGNGTSDILWQDNAGDVATWTVQNGTAVSATGLGNIGGDWSVAGTGNFYGNGTSDILFTNTNGDVAQWEMQGGVAVAATTVGVSGAGWNVIGTGDVYGSGTDDVLFEYTNGTIADWQVQNGVAVGASVVGATSSDWIFAGVGNLSGTAGTNDLLFINNDGAVADWDVANGVATAAHSIGQTSSYWSIVGIGDFTSNGQNDILFRGQGGEIAMWTMQNGVATGAETIGVTTSDWQIVGLGDYNGDGTDDILFRNSNSGAVAVWEMNGGHVSSVANVGASGANWQVTPAASGVTLPS